MAEVEFYGDGEAQFDRANKVDLNDVVLTARTDTSQPIIRAGTELRPLFCRTLGTNTIATALDLHRCRIDVGPGRVGSVGALTLGSGYVGLSNPTAPDVYMVKVPQESTVLLDTDCSDPSSFTGGPIQQNQQLALAATDNTGASLPIVFRSTVGVSPDPDDPMTSRRATIST